MASPQMTPDHWRQVEAILDQALELPPDEVDDFLARACEGNAELRAELEELLAADRQAGEFLEVPAAEMAETLLEVGAREGKPPGTDHPLAGRQLGPYRVLRRIGGGGMGEVYLARDTRLERSVALKLLPAEWSRDAAAKERFDHEARAASVLDHPNICTIHDVGETPEGRLYLVMAYYDGETVERRLRHGPLEIAAAVELTIQAARGLQRAHEAGIVHRDIKPANLMVTGHGEVKILDFGIAKMAGGIGLTRTGTSLGTPSYMSPEQARGDPVDARSDLWSLGAVLYEMVAGRRPFPGEHAQAVIHAIVRRDPDRLDRVRPETPQAVVEAAARALAKNPAERYQNAGELLAALGAGAAVSIHAAVDAAGSTPPATELTVGAARASAVIRVLVVAHLVGDAARVRSVVDTQTIDLAHRHDRLIRDLLARFDGLEIEKSDGFFLLFDRPADAVEFALAYHQALARLAQMGQEAPAARVGIHLGEVLLRHNAASDVTRGAHPIEVEGPAKLTPGRLAALAGGKQTLLTRAVFDLARQAAADGELADPELRWLAHGAYSFDGVDEPLEVFEVGVAGFAPLREPAGRDRAHRVVALGDELTLGWRPAPGQPIPRRANWTLERRIGEGGFGEVWLARHKSGDPRVFKFCFEAARLRALKREVTLFRLLKEALGHRDDIARILDWNFDDPPYFIESEYTEGGNLVDWASAQGGITEVPMAVRIELIAEVAEALAAAHSVGVLHKDVKPENVLVALDRDGRPRPRLTDFGIGLLTDQGVLAAQGFTVLGFTQTSLPTDAATGGTVRYMAPELLEGKPATIQADVYSLGVMLYQMVAGDFARALAPGWRREVPDEILAEDLAQLLDGRPERRPATAHEVAERLRSLDQRRARRDEERRARAEAERSRRLRRVLGTVAAAATVFLVVVSFLALKAVRARGEADLRRRQAEGLVDFMLFDLRDGLESIGRLDLLGKVADKAQEYLETEPAKTEGVDDLHRRATSLLNTADVLLDGETPARPSPATARRWRSFSSSPIVNRRSPGGAWSWRPVVRSWGRHSCAPATRSPPWSRSAPPSPPPRSWPRPSRRIPRRRS